MPVPNWTFPAAVVSVYDGDTITVLVDRGFSPDYSKLKLRLMGFDTPERRGSQKKWGLISRSYMLHLLSESPEKWKMKTDWGNILLPRIIVQTHKPDKFGGRWLATIWRPGEEQSLNDRMVADGYARAYHGQKKTEYPLDELPAQPEDFDYDTDLPKKGW